jgi:DnaJ-class molecular chaperone
MHEYEILGLKPNATKDEIKKAYKEIAITCHPDKLMHITDEVEKEKRIDKFKKATIAYNKLSGSSAQEDIDINDDSFWASDIFMDVAKMFINNNIRPKAYYNPVEKSIEERIVHKVKLDVSYIDILNNTKKKVRLILVDIQDPIFIDIYCGKFPQVTKQYIDDDDIEHDIIIEMMIKKTDADGDIDHMILSSGAIDLIKTVDVTLKEYILGYTKNILYIDSMEIPVTVPAFQKEYYEIANKGILGGSLILNICIKYIEKNAWYNFNENDKVEMLRLLDTLQK